MHLCAPVIRKDLIDKHSLMKQDPFQFLRGTYYRWAQMWPIICAEELKVPIVLSVGDLHVDSFGTWRDAEGRLCWGVDDFDEAFPLPYTNDLIRLATSAKIARKLGLMSVKTKVACESILDAYEQTIKNGGCPIVLAEQERHLEKLGIRALKTPKDFWKKLNEKPPVHKNVPQDAKKALEAAMPDPNLDYKVVQREAGLGSLGQQRFVALAQFRGGCIAREAKRVVPSASIWLNGRTGHCQSYYRKAMSGARRSLDPYQIISGNWLIRRLSPDSNPIEVEGLPQERDEETLLKSMGIEVANVHSGNAQSSEVILRDFRRRDPNWLRVAAKTMAKLILKEWKEYRN